MTVPALSLLAGVARTLSAAPQFDSHHLSTVMVAMRDGVRLATDVYRPARQGQPVEGRFPVILYRTPYDRSGLAKDGAFFARHGYVVLAQDCRGRFASEGSFYAFVNEGRDGYDAIEWAAAQPCSDGRVVTAGASYLAWDQYHAAMYRPPHLAGMFALVGRANFYQEYAYPGGTPNLGWPAWLLRSAATSPEALRDPRRAAPLQAVLKDPWPWLGQHPHRRAEVFRDFPDHARMYQDLLEHPQFDSAWKQPGFYLCGSYRRIKDVPALLVSGWYDYFAEGVLDNYRAFARMHKSPTFLIMGTWPHATGSAECGDASFGAEAAVDQRALMLEWFEHILRGQPLRIIGPAPVRFFLMGGGPGDRDARGRLRHGGRWLDAPGWPPSGVRTVRYYLGEGARLVTAPTAAVDRRTFVFDPDDPVPTIGGRYGVPGTPACAQNQMCASNIPGCKGAGPLDQRPDVLTYSTAPLDRPLAIAGKVRVTLWVSSDAPDTDFTAKLVDVYHGGRRASFVELPLFTPGQ
ncbi:MAG: CocE/NonD family hydrolase [Bryobacteraceae bacterium]